MTDQPFTKLTLKHLVKVRNTKSDTWTIIDTKKGVIVQTLPTSVTGTIVDHIPEVKNTAQSLDYHMDAELPSNLATNVAHFREITEDLVNIYEDKNKRYRNSFNKTLDKRGLVAALTRLDDKMNRLDYLVEGLNASVSSSEEEAKRVAALVDTLNDAANYLIMTRMWVENRTT